MPSFPPRRSTGTLESRHESSEIISESEEFEAVRALEQEALSSLEAGQHEEAVGLISDALEIDANNASLLKMRAQLRCQLSDFEGALADAELVASLEQFSCEASCFRSAILRKLERNEEAIQHSIRCLSMEDCNLLRVKAALLLSFRRLLPHLAEQLDALKDIEIYNFLCQLGVVAAKESRQSLTIHLLEVAQTYETEQLGLRMLLLLSLANSYASKKHSEMATDLYTECLKVATEVHDWSYQIKCLVSLAAMHLRADNVAQATAYYQRLVDLRRDAGGGSEILGADWSPELECGLLLNLSICCAALGNLAESQRYAELSVAAASSSAAPASTSAHMQAQCRSNCGLALLRAGRPDLARESLEAALRYAKRAGDPALLASCQGLLGTVLAELRNAGLSAAYHEQQILNCRRGDDRDGLVRAHLSRGDSLRILANYEVAVEAYKEAASLALRPEMKLLAEVKIGETQLTAERPQRALYHFERCLEMADPDATDQLQSVQLQVAIIHQLSSAPESLDAAERAFYQLLPSLERSLDRAQPWDAQAPTELLRDLRRCYLGLANVAAKRGKAERALLAAEAARRKSLSQHLASRAARFEGVEGAALGKEKRLRLNWDMDRLLRTVDLQTTPLLCLALVSDGCLVWLLQPGRGLVGFEHRTSAKGFSAKRLRTLIAETLACVKYEKLRYFSEGRAVPQDKGRLRRQQRRYETLSRAYRRAEAERLFDEAEAAAAKAAAKIDNGNRHPAAVSEKSPAEQLYRMLLGSLADQLQSLPEDTCITIVTDDALAGCPFELTPLGQRHCVFRACSLFHLDCAINGELDRLRADEDAEFERQLAKGGGSKFGAFDSPEPTAGAEAAVSKRALKEAPQKPAKKKQPSTGGAKVTFATAAATVECQSGGAETKAAGTALSAAGLSANPRQLSNPHLLRAGDASTSDRPSAASTKPSPPQVGSSGRPSSRAAARGRVADTVSTLTSRTATDTDVAASTLYVTPFRQISDRDKCVAIGNPQLPKHITVDGEPWTTVSHMQQAHSELRLVGEMCEVCPIEGAAATKEAFLTELQAASVLHIATYACIHRGYFAMSPNPSRQGPAEEEPSFLVTPLDLMQCRLRARLVALSCGWTVSPQQQHRDDEETLLPSLLLSLGAQCVLWFAWPLPGRALADFWRNFYLALQWGRADVSGAVRAALDKLREDEEFNRPEILGAVRLYGKDVPVNLADIRSAQLSHTIDAIESEDGARQLLNEDDRDKFPREAALMYEMQSLVSAVLRNNKGHPDCVEEIASLLDGALKRLFLGNPGKTNRRLAACLADFPDAVRVLRFLGFHFQPDFEDTGRQLVAFPHWDRDGLLLPAYHVFASLQAIVSHPSLTEALFQLLPTSQEKISYLVDLLAITKHAEELQVKQSDLTVRVLLGQPRTLALVRQLGFVELGKFLYFSKTRESRALLSVCLQLLISLSTHKSPSLMHRLDPELLGNQRGGDGVEAAYQPIRELSRLSTLEPVLLPKNQLRMATPWMTLMETADEMAEKMLLSRAHTDIERHVLAAVRRTHTWQLEGLKATAVAGGLHLPEGGRGVGGVSSSSLLSRSATQTTLDAGQRRQQPAAAVSNQPPATVGKVKVHPGGTPSCTRCPVDYKAPPSLPQVAEKRAQAHRVMEDRLTEIGERRDAKLKELFLPYIHG